MIKKMKKWVNPDIYIYIYIYIYRVGANDLFEILKKISVLCLVIFSINFLLFSFFSGFIWKSPIQYLPYSLLLYFYD